jgi:hypothetical protein
MNTIINSSSTPSHADQWFAALANKPIQGSKASIVSDAQQMREVVLDYLRHSSSHDEQLPAPTAWQTIKHTAANAPLFAIAACVALVGVGITLQMNPATPAQDPPVVWRGDEPPTSLRSATPLQDAVSLEQMLIAQGIKTYLAQANQTATLQAKISLEDTATRSLLKARGIEVPAHGRLNLVFVKK